MPLFLGNLGYHIKPLFPLRLFKPCTYVSFIHPWVFDHPQTEPAAPKNVLESPTPLPHTYIYIRREDDSNFINFVYLTLWFYTFGKLYYNKTCWYRLTRGIRIQHLNKTPHAYSSLTCCKPCLWSNWRALINTLKPWLEEENLHTEHLFAFWETTRTSNTPSRLSLNRRLPLRTN